MARIITDRWTESAKIAGTCLTDKGLLLYPTDTIYGLGCDALQNKSVQKIREIKGRRENKPFILLTGSMSRVESNFEVEDFSGEIDKIWPGPFTLLLKPKNPILNGLRGPNGKIGVRMPGDFFLAQLFSNWDGLLTSTSANKSGVPYNHNWKKIVQTFRDSVNIMIQRERYPLSKP